MPRKDDDPLPQDILDAEALDDDSCLGEACDDEPLPDEADEAIDASLPDNVKNLF